MSAYRENHTDRAVDVDDLIQESFIAMLQAVETYQGGGRMTFLGWWEMYLKTAYNRALGVQWERTAKDPIRLCISLSEPLNGKGGGTLAEVIPDRRSHVEAAEAAVWREELRESLNTALEAVPAEWRTLIEGRYVCGKTLQELAAETGTTHQAVSKKTVRALKQIRKQDTGGHLAEFAAQL